MYYRKVLCRVGVYNGVTSDNTSPNCKLMWKGKGPAKIKIFMYLIVNNDVLTKERMLKRNQKGCPKCYFYEHNETVSHLFFPCTIARLLWSVVPYTLGASDIPQTICHNVGHRLRNGRQMVCWAIRKSRDRAYVSTTS